MVTQRGEMSSVLSGPQRALLTAILDSIIPPDGSLPGAGGLGTAKHIDTVVAGSLGLRRLFTDGLAAIEAASRTMFSNDFSSLSGEERMDVLREVEAKHPEFFEALVRHTYSGYYSNPTVVRLLGLEERPPQPKGYRLDPFDAGLLGRVKDRGKIYRET